MYEQIKPILCKLLSGRLLMTAVCAISFGYMSIMRILEPKDSLSVIMVVFAFYFNRTDRPTPNSPIDPTKPS